MTFTGYYQRPTLMGDTLVFVYEDDLWLTELKKGAVTAYRLTANPGRANDPQLCPDGQHLAFTSLDEGHPEVFVTRLDEMEPQRLTYLGEDTRCVGWTRDGSEVLFATNAGNPFSRIFKLASVHRDGGPASRLGLGPAAHVSYAPKKGRVIGRHTWDPARWKRYRGGTAGQLWIDPKEDGQFHQLLELNGNLTRPLWVGDRIYFGSDHEGICNLYSCNRQGKGLRQHTFHKDFYIRYPNTDGKRIVYQCGGDIYLFDPSAKKPGTLPGELCPEPDRLPLRPRGARSAFHHGPLGRGGSTARRARRCSLPTGELGRAGPHLRERQQGRGRDRALYAGQQRRAGEIGSPVRSRT